MERDAHRVRWRANTDLESFRSALEAGDDHSAPEAYAGRLLQGFRVDHTPEFESWLEMEREQLHDAWRRACLAHARALRSSERHDVAADFLERLLGHDVLDEHVLHERLVTLTQSGRRAEALAVYASFERRLQEAIGEEPSAETKSLVEAIREASTAQRPTVHRAGSSAGRKSCGS